MTAGSVITLLSLVGILLSALMGSYGYLYRAKEEQKRNSRRVLYVLLEIRNSIMRSLIKPKVVKDMYFDYLIERFASLGVEVEKCDIPQEMAISIEELLANISKASMKDIEKELQNEYEEALSAMAPENPVLAYSLRGKEVIDKILGHTNSYIETARKNLSALDAEDWMQKVLIKSLEEAKQQVEIDTIELLNKDVIKLANACGASDRKAVKAVIERQSDIYHLVDFDELNNFFDKYIENITAAAKEQIEMNEKQEKSEV